MIHAQEKLFGVSAIAALFGQLEHLNAALQTIALLVAIVSGLVLLASRLLQLLRNWRDRNKTLFPIERPPKR